MPKTRQTYPIETSETDTVSTTVDKPTNRFQQPGYVRRRVPDIIITLTIYTENNNAIIHSPTERVISVDYVILRAEHVILSGSMVTNTKARPVAFANGHTWFFRNIKKQESMREILNSWKCDSNELIEFRASANNQNNKASREYGAYRIILP